MAELVRRKRTAPVPTTKYEPRKYDDYDDVKARVDRLWKDSYRPSYTPPAPRRDADDFLRWGGGGRKSDADDFLAFSGGRRPTDADAFLAFSGGGGRPYSSEMRSTDRPMCASSADDFLSFAGGSGGGSFSGTKPLAKDADAFLNFAAGR